MMSSMQFQNFLDLDDSVKLDSLLDLGRFYFLIRSLHQFPSNKTK